jgi:hypothetical protein
MYQIYEYSLYAQKYFCHEVLLKIIFPQKFGRLLQILKYLPVNMAIWRCSFILVILLMIVFRFPESLCRP